MACFNESVDTIDQKTRLSLTSINKIMKYCDLLHLFPMEYFTKQEQFQKAQQLTTLQAQQLSEQRQIAAAELAKELTAQLESLNMPKAQFHVKVTPQKQTRSGNEKIEFFISPNQGENQIALKDGASGGELARVLLAL